MSIIRVYMSMNTIHTCFKPSVYYSNYFYEKNPHSIITTLQTIYNTDNKYPLIQSLVVDNALIIIYYDFRF